LCHDIEHVEKYIAYIGAHELDSLINEKVETSKDVRMIKRDIYVILHICINEFSDNAYVIKYTERALAAMKSTNVLQEEDDEKISMEEEVCEEEKEEDMVQPELEDVLEPLKDDSNTQTQNSIVIFENPCPSSTSEIFDNNECCLDVI
jgi:ERCC4-related helicase